MDHWWQYAAAGAGGVVAAVAALSYKYPWLKYDLGSIKKLLKVKRIVDKYQSEGTLIIDVFERKCRQHPKKPFLIFEVRVVKIIEV